MGKNKIRKTIALVMACPEEDYQQSILSGVFDQAEKYGYNVAVFAMNVQTWHYFKDYLEGEENIYNLINYEKFDGVIVAPITLSNNNMSTLARRVYDKLNLTYKGKVVSLNLPFDDYETVYNDDREAEKVITKHLIEEHNCRDIICLTGFADVEVSRQRLKGYKDALTEHGIEIKEENIVFGDFWYPSGRALAEEIISGKRRKPDAVVCGNDHMAISFMEEMTKAGYKIPEDVLVTGFDATREACINEISLTSYKADDYSTGAKAVNKIREAIEPGEPVIPVGRSTDSGLVLAESCGCKSSISDIKKSLRSFITNGSQLGDNNNNEDPNNIARLNESYMFEALLAQYNARQLLEFVDLYTYIIRPFKELFLVLREDCFDMDASYQKGYPDKMRVFMHKTLEYESLSRVDNRFTADDTKLERSFDTNMMLPELFDESEEPAAFFFSPIHFNREAFGYAVLKCDLLCEYKVGSVYRNWLRNISNAIEMIRVKARLIDESIEDSLTGLLNRRGMSVKTPEIFCHMDKEAYIIMIDMDGLKMINDNYGHEEGDFGILTIANAMKSLAKSDDLCVRSGGDEFLIIGIADEPKAYADALIERIRKYLADAGAKAGKPYPLTASFGYSINIANMMNFNDMLKHADEQMYVEKHAKHEERL